MTEQEATGRASPGTESRCRGIRLTVFDPLKGSDFNPRGQFRSRRTTGWRQANDTTFAPPTPR